MKTFLSTHNLALKAEWLKLRHSGMIWLLVGITAFIPILFTISGFFTDNVKEGEVWSEFLAGNFQGFTGFFYPLFVVIMILRIVYLEHKSDTWKLMETQPVAKAALFVAKWEVAAIISLLALIGLVLFSLVGGFIIQMFRSDTGFKTSSIEWASVSHVVLRYWIGSLGIISIQYFLSLLIKSFAWPMSIGLVAIIAGSILVQFGVFTWWPYATSILTTISYEGSESGQFLLSHEKLSLLWSAMFLWLGYMLFVNKGFARAYIKPFSKLGLTAVLSLIFIAGVWWLNKPKELDRYNKTVLAGDLKTKTPITNVVLLEAPLMDTIITIPINKDGSFHSAIDKELVPGMYILRAGKRNVQVYFGKNDSLFVELDLDKNRSEPKISGTRMAENEFLSVRANNSSDWELTDYAYNLSPEEYAQKAMANLRDKNNNAAKFKTIDRVKLSPDFMETMKNLNSVYYSSLLMSYYPRIHAIYYPNQELKYPGYAEKFLKETNLYDDKLISFSEYRNFIVESTKEKYNGIDSAYFDYLGSIFKGDARDKIIYEAAQTNLFKIRDSLKRAKLTNAVVGSLGNEKAKKGLLEAEERMNRMRRGQKAHNFIAEALNGKTMTLNDLANRYVVIDVWATWCGPCKKEAPYFEQLADQYTSEQVAFLSVSVDEEKKAWTFEAMNKKNKRILQLWSKDAENDFNKGFAINSIPRFILIDPKGNIVNSNMPPPSDPEFETILQKEIPSLVSRL